MENEIWKDVKGYEGLYQVSNLGNVKRLAAVVFVDEPGRNYFRNVSEKKLTMTISPKGYYRIGIYKDKVQSLNFVHRLVAEAFIINSDSLPHINHIDGNKINNCVNNLEWTTPKNNTAHAIRTGLIKFSNGEKSRNVKLKNSEVLEIAELIKKQVSNTEIAIKYNVTTETISAIKTGKNWLHLTQIKILKEK